VKTAQAAKYLGLSPAHLRRMRMYAPGDPQPKGPPFRKISHNLVLYDIAALDAWLEARPAQRSSLA
jgi:predicted DNA-binding transcriptional regulator AlpA